MIMRDAFLKEVQEILGHKTMTMTLRYARLSQEKGDNPIVSCQVKNKNS
jgi:integrase